MAVPLYASLHLQALVSLYSSLAILHSLYTLVASYLCSASFIWLRLILSLGPPHLSYLSWLHSRTIQLQLPVQTASEA